MLAKTIISDIKPGKIDNRCCWDIILKLIERRSVPILKR